MKSLEIVKYKMGLFEKKKTGFVVISWFELYQIKKDLEVLEIIIKKKVNVATFMNFLKIEDNEKILEIYNHINYAQSKLTLEEIVKLKQWLEKCEKYTKIG